MSGAVAEATLSETGRVSSSTWRIRLALTSVQVLLNLLIVRITLPQVRANWGSRSGPITSDDNDQYQQDFSCADAKNVAAHGVGASANRGASVSPADAGVNVHPSSAGCGSPRSG